MPSIWGSARRTPRRSMRHGSPRSWRARSAPRVSWQPPTTLASKWMRRSGRFVGSRIAKAPRHCSRPESSRHGIVTLIVVWAVTWVAAPDVGGATARRSASSTLATTLPGNGRFNLGLSSSGRANTGTSGRDTAWSPAGNHPCYNSRTVLDDLLDVVVSVVQIDGSAQALTELTRGSGDVAR